MDAVHCKKKALESDSSSIAGSFGCCDGGEYVQRKGSGDADARVCRVKTRSYSGEPQGQTTPAVSFYYDGKGLAQLQTPHNFAKGKLTKVDNTVSETQYQVFDNLGRITQMAQITDGQTYTSKYTYNFSGALIEEEYPSGRKVKNEFESDGDIARIYGKATPTATERTYANSFSYMPDGRIEKLKLGNGLWEAAKFNTRLQVTEFALGHGPESGNLWKLQKEYGELQSNGTVDASKNTGNIARQTLSFDGLPQPFVTGYEYDSLYRLVNAKETQNGTRTWEQGFTYDRYGNRLSHDKFIGASQISQTNLTHPTIDANTNRFTAGQGYAFDKNGNLVTDPADSGRSFVFNGDNKQAEVRGPSNELIGEYFYDGEGRRVKKHRYVGGVLTEVTVFVYSAGKLAAEYSTAPPEQNPTTKWTVTDQLGSPRVLVDTLGQVVSRRDFMPFGEEITPDGTHRTTDLKYNFGDNVRQKFTGYQKDEETQLDFAEARMYENRHARFTAVDPLLASGKNANPQTFNRYVYVLNNPLIFTDPTGLQTTTVPGRWFNPNQPNKRFEYIKNGATVPEGYTEVTTTNKRGELIAPGMGIEEWEVIRFNPNGPFDGRFLDIDDWLWMSQYEYSGWDVIRNDVAQDAFMRSGAVQDVSVELFTFGMPVARGAGAVLRSGAGSRLTAQQFADDAFVDIYQPRLLESPTTVKHHIFNVFRGNSPKSDFYRQFFKTHGIDVEKYGVEIPEAMHKKFIHGAGNNWTTRWKQWIDANPNATTKEVYQFAGQLMDEYGLSGLPIIPLR
ncbi:MAG TPA: RHS repeat-associated core domain-containing protein [Pyrinomonadaceae bacterium]|nr:RHS repeat-associated core domain-containing protein [Pyrinomonadaceae bacterium]